jgi:hypothetical protein
MRDGPRHRGRAPVAWCCLTKLALLVAPSVPQEPRRRCPCIRARLQSCRNRQPRRIGFSRWGLLQGLKALPLQDVPAARLKSCPDTPRSPIANWQAHLSQCTCATQHQCLLPLARCLPVVHCLWPLRACHNKMGQARQMGQMGRLVFGPLTFRRWRRKSRRSRNAGQRALHDSDRLAWIFYRFVAQGWVRAAIRAFQTEGPRLHAKGKGLSKAGYVRKAKPLRTSSGTAASNCTGFVAAQLKPSGAPVAQAPRPGSHHQKNFKANWRIRGPEAHPASPKPVVVAVVLMQPYCQVFGRSSHSERNCSLYLSLKLKFL